MLWLYTDGMVERRDRSLREGLEAFAQAAAGPPGAAADDDACVLRLEWQAT